MLANPHFPGRPESTRAPAAGAEDKPDGRDDMDWYPDLSNPPSGSDGPPDIHHVVIAPVRHLGAAVGFLMVFRSDRSNPYEAGDDDLIQVLANQIGAAVTASRVGQKLDQQHIERRAIAEQLAELTVEQQDLLEQLAGVAERERSVLAEAIHDDPLQIIVATILRMDLLQTQLPTAQADELDRLAETLQESVQHLRTLTVALTPPDLVDGVGNALRDLAEALFVGANATVLLRMSGHLVISPSRGLLIYRVMREALMNARKHSLAESIVIQLVSKDAAIVIRLTDTGVGASAFDAGPGHLGVATMRARARSAGGQLRIDSAPSVGTTITLTLPEPDPATR